MPVFKLDSVMEKKIQLDKELLLPFVLDEINDIRIAVGIGEGKLDKLPQGVKQDARMCVIAQALSNGWRAEVGTVQTELYHDRQSEVKIDGMEIVKTLNKLGFQTIIDLEEEWNEARTSPQPHPNGHFERIVIENTWAMRRLVNWFDEGFFPDLFINKDDPESAVAENEA